MPSIQYFRNTNRERGEILQTKESALTEVWVPDKSISLKYNGWTVSYGEGVLCHATEEESQEKKKDLHGAHNCYKVFLLIEI